MIRIALPQCAEEHVSFSTSPLLECVLSLHVLLGPQHHAMQHPWIRRMRRLDAKLRRRIEFFGFAFRTYVPDLVMPRAERAAGGFEDELDRLRRLEPELLLSAFVRPLADHGGRPTVDEEARRIALRRAAADGDELREGVNMLLDDPVAFAHAFAELLADYWLVGFGEMWARIEEPLEQSIHEAGRQLAYSGVWSVLGRLPCNCRVDRGHRELLIDLPHDHRVEIGSQRPLVLTPSFFVGRICGSVATRPGHSRSCIRRHR